MFIGKFIIKLKKETGQAPNLLEEMLKKLNLSKKDFFHQLKAKNLTGRAYNQVLEFLSDFKRVSISSYLNFLKTIKDSDELLKRLVFNSNQLVFDTFLMDLLPVKKKTVYNLS